jgi:phosphoribosylformylglycinamidine cyclo-ligase
MAHITGGGLPENLPRCLGANQSVQVDLNGWTPPPIFDWIARTGEVSPTAMFNTFNMGVGFVVIVAPENRDRALDLLRAEHLDPWVLGSVVAGEGGVLGLPA